MNNILLIDDDENFKDTFQIEAQNNDLRLIHRKSLEGLQDVMPKHHASISAVVLDIKCLISDDQAIENENFIGTALKYLDTNFPNFPRIVLTGDDDAFNNFKRFAEEKNIYQKTPDGLNEAIAKLKFYCENSELIKITIAHNEAFSVLRNYGYNQSAESTLVEILKNENETSFPRFGGIFRDIRSLQETIYKTINLYNKPVVPDSLIRPNGMLDFNKLMKHLNGYPSANFTPTKTEYHNSAIFNLANSLYWVCGKYIHADPAEKYYISNYTLRSSILSLIELIFWSKLYLPKNI
ncbi:hypothetical protein [Pseudomonas sp. I8001]|uniref:hypothetical protein n=1 Tax=Pseudomonas sp. I8001 TaxID=2738825 RepID=UPI0015A201DC|nr:hypothetical protein [Pseudomonas sp. I8001]NWB69698.1 hypothetical protein [Pseudomonas sp. I8001]